MNIVHPAVSDFMRQIGRRGAEIRQLTPADRAKGVQVRVLKAEFKRKGYCDREALRRARAAVDQSP